MQDLVDRNVVVTFLQTMATDLEEEARIEDTRAAPNEEKVKGCRYGAQTLRSAARAIEKLPGAEQETYDAMAPEDPPINTTVGDMSEDRFTVTEQGHQALERAACTDCFGDGEAQVGRGETYGDPCARCGGKGYTEEVEDGLQED